MSIDTNCAPLLHKMQEIIDQAMSAYKLNDIIIIDVVSLLRELIPLS